MDKASLDRFLIDAQAIADSLLARVALEDRPAAARLAEEVEAGRAVISLAFTVGRDVQAIELLIREEGRTTPAAVIPLRVRDTARNAS